MSEYVIKGNTAVLKCNIPSFVSDFVRVEAWLASDGTEFTSTTDFGTKFCDDNNNNSNNKISNDSNLFRSFISINFSVD